MMLRFILQTYRALFHRKFSIRPDFGPSSQEATITITTLDNQFVNVEDPLLREEIFEYFESISKVQKIVKALYEYKIQFKLGSREFSFRVTYDGMILNDLPASEIQDAYLPAKEGLSQFLKKIVNSTNPVF